MRSNKKLSNLVLAALFLALALVFPFMTMQIPEIGSMLCPMHIPVLICGFVCGWKYGLAVGFIAPTLRSWNFGMPPMFPTAFCMAFELAVYGLMCGLLYKALPKKKTNIYVSLIISMILGRIVWGLAMLICMGIDGNTFTAGAFLSGAIINAVPGIIIQIVLVPVIVMLFERTKNSRN